MLLRNSSVHLHQIRNSRSLRTLHVCCPKRAVMCSTSIGPTAAGCCWGQLRGGSGHGCAWNRLQETGSLLSPARVLAAYLPAPCGRRRGGNLELGPGCAMVPSSQNHKHPLPQVRALWVLGRGQWATRFCGYAIPLGSHISCDRTRGMYCRTLPHILPLAVCVFATAERAGNHDRVRGRDSYVSRRCVKSMCMSRLHLRSCFPDLAVGRVVE